LNLIRRTRAADILVPVLLFCASFGYLYLFVRLGWFLQDEGYLYYQYLRAFRGQVPYRDFFTGYGPITLYLHAALFSLFGVSIGVARVFLAIVHSVSAVCLYAIGRRFTTRVLAAVPPLLFLTMQPGDISDMAFHNTPYPLWYAVALTVIGAWVMLRSLEAGSPARRLAWLVFAGFIGGTTLLTKQNSGVFFLWGVSGFLFSHPGEDRVSVQDEQRSARWLRLAYLALIPLATLYLIGGNINAVTLGFFVAPAATMALVGARQGFGPAAWWRLRLDVLSVGFGFLVAVVPWLVHLGALVGLDTFLRALFFVGVDPERSLYRPFPVPWIPTWIMLNVLLAAVLGYLVAWGARFDPGARMPAAPRRRAAAWVVALAALLPAAWLITTQQKNVRLIVNVQNNPWEVCTQGSTAIDNLAAYLIFLVLAAAIVRAWRHTSPAGRSGTDSFLSLLWITTCALAAYYPRMDAAHLVAAAPLAYVVAVALVPKRVSILAQMLTEARHFSSPALLAGEDEGEGSEQAADGATHRHPGVLQAGPLTHTLSPRQCGERDRMGALGTEQSLSRTDVALVGQFGRRILAAACVLLLGLAVGLKLAPKVYSRIMLARAEGHLHLAATPVENLRFDRADVYFPVYKSVHRLRVESFREMVQHVQNTIGTDEPFFVFPALAMAYFVSERDNPTRHDYFLGSNVRFDEQVEIIRILEQDRVELVVVPSDQNDYFLKSCRPYTRLLWAYLKQSYYLERRLDKYDVLRRYGTTSGSDSDSDDHAS
jgi:hypothetical protein